MKRKIFRSMLVVTSVVAVISILSVMFLFFPIVENEIVQEMKAEAELIMRGIDVSGTSFLDGLSEKGRRITLIQTDGTVVYDTGSSPGTLDNHLNREEVQNAIHNGEGIITRFSNTMTSQTINYAVRMNDGRILRLSVRQNYVIELVLWLIPPALIIVVLIVIMSAAISRKVSNRILTPLYEMDPEHPERNEVYEELLPLTRKIEEQNQNLKEKIYKDARLKQKKISEFTSNMTHELKTPLTSISGFAELMKEDIDPETVKDFAGSIHEEAARLILLVGDIIKLGEMDEKERDFVFGPVELPVIIEDVIDRLSVGADRKKIKINTDVQDITIDGEERILYEMMYNLLDNAVKYTPDHGRIDIRLTADDEHIYCSFSDTGIGISEEKKEHIFERFYRGDHTDEEGGTGLGLSIVKEGALIHDAEITIDSEENKGTTITLIFHRSLEEKQ